MRRRSVLPVAPEAQGTARPTRGRAGRGAQSPGCCQALPPGPGQRAAAHGLLLLQPWAVSPTSQPMPRTEHSRGRDQRAAVLSTRPAGICPGKRGLGHSRGSAGASDSSASGAVSAKPRSSI